MGRALKIQKVNIGAGSTTTGTPPVTTYNQNIPTDLGFPPFSALTDPVYNEPIQTLDAAQFLGVVGGSPTTSSPSATYPEITVYCNILQADGTATYDLASSYAGRIIRQKGAHKFLVVYTGGTVAPSAFIVGQAYQIVSVGTTTNWGAVGANGSTVAAGDIFTATAAGSGNGTAYPVGVCVLYNGNTPAAGYMSIGYEVGDSSAVYASYLTNKWIRDWNGMTYSNYSDSNLGNNNYTNENYYVANFFTDEGTVTQSGLNVQGSALAQNGTVALAMVDNTTS